MSQNTSRWQFPPCLVVARRRAGRLGFCVRLLPDVYDQPLLLGLVLADDAGGEAVAAVEVEGLDRVHLGGGEHLAHARRGRGRRGGSRRLWFLRDFFLNNETI